jgi:NADH:ubiquinone oxidoreductase subunit 6 (subunit J)
VKHHQVVKRYTKEFMTAMITYVITLIASIFVLQRYEFPKFWQILISLVPAVPVVFVVVAMIRALKDSDELQQRVQLLATSFAAALTGLITFTYGFLENVGFPKFPTFLVFPMLIMIWGLSLGYFSRRYQ